MRRSPQAEGPITSQIAHYLTTILFPLSDVVIDIHSGGRSMEEQSGLVRLEPPCPQRELADWYRAATLVVVPSLIGSRDDVGSA